jgi:TPR repeat protein
MPIRHPRALVYTLALAAVSAVPLYAQAPASAKPAVIETKQLKVESHSQTIVPVEATAEKAVIPTKQLKLNANGQPIMELGSVGEAPKGESLASMRARIVKPAPQHGDTDFAEHMLQALYEKAKAADPGLSKRDFVLAFHDKAVAGEVKAGYYYGAARFVGWGIQNGPEKEVEGFIGAGAKAGLPEAQRDYALVQFFGLGVPASRDTAFLYAKKSADAGLPSGQALAAEFIHSGVGTKEDIPASTALFRKAADAGDLIACQRYGEWLLGPEDGSASNSAAAVPYLEKAAAAGDDRARTNLGLMYLSGNGVKENMELGYNYLQSAAEVGNASAQRWIGVAYLNGEDHAQDDQKGALYLESSAINGDSNAQIEWGLINLDGNFGIAKNRDEGMKWMLLASKSGNPRAAEELRKRKQKP